jgi:hypothetical protein
VVAKTAAGACVSDVGISVRIRLFDQNQGILHVQFHQGG